MSDILFYISGQPYDIFSNVSKKAPVYMNIGGQPYESKSSEGFFQGLKAITGGNHDQATFALLIKMEPGGDQQKVGTHTPNSLWKDNSYWNPSLAIKYPGSHLPPFPVSPPHDFTIKERLMYELVLMKATQNPEILKALLDTGNHTLVENTSLAKYVDKFWGNGGDKKIIPGARNALGKIWEMARANLNDELTKTGQILVRQGLTQDLSTVLKLGYMPGQEYAQPLSKSYIGSLNSITLADDITINLKPGQLTPTVMQRPVAAPHHQGQSATAQTDPNSAYARALEGFRKISPDIQSFRLEVDPKNSSKHIFKLQLAPAANIRDLQTRLQASETWRIQGNEFTIGEVKAQTALNSTGYGTYGKRTQQLITEKLISEFQPHISSSIQPHVVQATPQIQYTQPPQPALPLPVQASYPLGSAHDMLTKAIDTQLAGQGNIIKSRVDNTSQGINFTVSFNSQMGKQAFLGMLQPQYGLQLPFYPDPQNLTITLHPKDFEKLLAHHLKAVPHSWLPKLLSDQQLYDSAAHAGRQAIAPAAHYTQHPTGTPSNSHSHGFPSKW